MTKHVIEKVDITIVGAGPAGIAAAEILRGNGLKITIVDEQARPGGQITRQPPAEFNVKNWLKHKSYGPLKTALSAIENAPEIDWRMQTAALGLFHKSGDDAEWRLWVRGGGTFYTIASKIVVLAQGCSERPFAFPGWTTPGVMGAGAIQTLHKSQQLIAGENILFSGSHPLQLIVADQLHRAGANIRGVLFAQSFKRVFKLFRHPETLISHWRKIADITEVIARLKMAGVPIKFSHTITSVRRENGYVAAAVLAPVTQTGHPDYSKSKSVTVDCVGLCYGFQASSELARQAGASSKWDEDNGGWLIETNGCGLTSRPNLYAIGELTGQAGGDAAANKGKLAAINILENLGITSASSSTTRITVDILRKQTAFSELLNQLSRPPDQLASSVANDSTLLCRCECISHDDYRNAIRSGASIGAIDSAKLKTRVGMGMCQGRQCYSNAARILAEELNVPIAALGAPKAQPPIKPLEISEIVGQPLSALPLQAPASRKDVT